MKQFCIQLKVYIHKNKIWLLLLAAYTTIMISIMGKVQSDVPFISMHNFFYTEGIVIIIFIVQSALLISTFFKNAAKTDCRFENGNLKYALNNIAISIIFSITGAVFMAGVFLLAMFLYNHNYFKNFNNTNIYYFGIYFKGISIKNIVQMIIYTFSANMVIMSVSNLLSYLEKKWHYLLSGLMVFFLLVCMLIRQKTSIVISRFFEVYGSPYSLSIVLILITVGILTLNYIVIGKGINE